MFSESFTGRLAVLQLSCSPSKQRELSENIFHNLKAQKLYCNDLVYTVGRPIGREVLKMRILGVPLACLGSR